MSLYFPYEFKNVTEEEDGIIKKYYKGYSRPFVRGGPIGHLSMAGYMDHAAEIYNLEVRPDDVWITSFSRSGTTWLQALVWLVLNNLDYQVPVVSEIDGTSNANNASIPQGIGAKLFQATYQTGFLQAFALVLYIARDPRDVVVSFHFAHKLFRYFDDSVTIKEFWDLFKRDLIIHTPIFAHIKEAWNARSQPNLLFLFYEDMNRDLPSSIDRVCTFLGKNYTAEQKDQLAQHLSFENMKKNANIISNKDNEENSFIRKGQSGGWVQYFDEDMKKEADEFMAKNLASTDLCFPSTH